MRTSQCALACYPSMIKKMHNPSPKPGKKEEEEEEDSFGFLLPIRRSSCCYALCVGVESRVQGGHNNNNNAKGERGTTTSAREETKKKRRREKRLEEMRICIPGGRKLRGHQKCAGGRKVRGLNIRVRQCSGA